MTDTMIPTPLCEWFVGCVRPATGVVVHPALGNVPTCVPCAEKLDLDLVRCVLCTTCAMHIFLACRETVGTCDACKEHGDVAMDYCESGDREKPDQTLCLDCMIDRHLHLDHAHEETP